MRHAPLECLKQMGSALIVISAGAVHVANAF